MSFVVVLIGISDCLGSQYYIPVGKRSVSARIIIVGAVVNVGPNLVMIPKLGAIGASIATVIAEAIIAVFYIVFASDYCPLLTILKCGYKKLIAGVVMYIVLLFVNFFGLPPIVLLLTKTIIGVIVYLGVLVILKDAFLSRFLGEGKKMVIDTEFEKQLQSINFFDEENRDGHIVNKEIKKLGS